MESRLDTPIENSTNLSREAYVKKYSVKKLYDHKKPFLDYLGYKDEQEAVLDLFKYEIKPAEAENTLIKREVLTQVCNTALSYVGVTTNQEKAKKCLKIIFATIIEQAKEKESEAVLIINALNQLSIIYKELPKRSSYSVANLFYNPPRVLSALERIFKEYDVDPLDVKLEEKTQTVFKSFH